MSIESAMVAGVRSQALSSRATQLIQIEARKGCEPYVLPHPVTLEPAYQPLVFPRGRAPDPNAPCWTYEPPRPDDGFVRLQLWLSPEQECDWRCSELLIKLMSSLRSRCAFEIVGNRTGVSLMLACSAHDAPTLQAAFIGLYDRCDLVPAHSSPLHSLLTSQSGRFAFYDLFTPPPYSHLLTQPTELKRFPAAIVISTLDRLPESSIGVYQVLFEPVPPEHNWHANVQALLDLEYATKLLSGMSDPRNYVQQAPSGALPHMATDVASKAHNDKPFFVAAWRIGVLGDQGAFDAQLLALTAISGLVQHGGRPLSRISDEDYAAVLPHAAIRRMFFTGDVYRPGFLVNSWELTSLVHIPRFENTEQMDCDRGFRLEPLRPSPELSHGTPLGYCDVAGHETPVCIPLEVRPKHVHIIGRSGTGKSTMIEHMIIDDVERGCGVVLLDPHGDLVDRVLALVPDEHVERTIYFNAGDPDWVPLWNPFRPIPGHDIGRTADDLVNAFKSFVDGWGDRLEHLLRHLFHGVLHLPSSSLLQVSSLLRTDSDRSEALRTAIRKALEPGPAHDFWNHDLKGYRKDDLGPPRNKLSKLLLSGTVSAMFSQPASAISLHDIMSRGMVLLADLSTVGSQVRGLLGSLMLAKLWLAALARRAVPLHERRAFHIYADEAHRFVTDTLEECIVEMRKYNVSLTMAHQFMGQFSSLKASALSGVGTTIMFTVNKKDAEFLRRDLREQVAIEDLLQLRDFEALARIDGEIVRLRTREPKIISQASNRQRIIEQSLARYYESASVIRARTRQAFDASCAWQPRTPVVALDEDPGHDTF